MPSEAQISLHTKKRTRSSIALQVYSTAAVGIQVRTTRGERDRHTLYFELQYEELGNGLNHATSWYRTVWKDSRPNEIRRVQMIPSTKGGRQVLLLDVRRLTVVTVGVSHLRHQ